MIQFQLLIDLDGLVLRARHDALPVDGHGGDGILVAGEVAEPADRSSARAASLSCKDSRPRRRLLEIAKDGLLHGGGRVHHGAGPSQPPRNPPEILVKVPRFPLLYIFVLVNTS